MSLAARIASVALVLVVVVGLTGAFQLAIVSDLASTATDLARVDVEGLALALGLQGSIGELVDASRKYHAVADPRYRVQAFELEREVSEDLAAIDRLALSRPERESADRLLGLWAEESPRLLERADGDPLGRVLEELAVYVRISRAQMLHRAELGALRARRARDLAIGATVAAIVLAAVLSLLAARSVVRPLRRLEAGTRELAAGNFSFRVEAGGAPEVRELAERFNQMSERLGELDRLKQDFVSNVSHDLKAPLASMLETTRLLLDQVPGPLNPRQERLLGLNRESGERLQAMIGNVLDLARLDAGGLEYRLAPCGLERVVRDALRDVSALAEKKGLEVSIEPEAPGLEACADESLLRRVVVNLLSNAVKFSPEGGTMGVRLYRLATADDVARRGGAGVAAPAVALEVWDSGPGIPEDHRRSVFERFHRVDETRRGDQSTGIGLAIAKSIVEGHGGRVWVEEEPAAGGARLVVLLESA